MNSTDFSASALVGLLFALAAFGLVGALCGRTRGKEGLGLLAGLFLGPLGWLLILLAYPVPPAPVAFTPTSTMPRFPGRPLSEKDAAWEKARLSE